MAAARDRGIVVELTLFCPLYRDDLWNASPMNARNNVNGFAACPRTEALTLRHKRLVEVQLAFTKKVVAELNPYDNLYFEVCNEPYFGGVTLPWQHRIADTIVATENDLPNRHLISLNIANGRKRVAKPHPAVSILNFHYCVPPDTVAMNYALGKAIGENETGFRGKHDLLYRTEGWDFLLAGGALYNNLDYSFTPPHPDGTFLTYKSPGGGSPALRKQLGILKRFLEGFDFVRMAPDAKAIKSVSPKLTATALAEPGRQYAICLHVPLPVKPKRVSDHQRSGLQATLVLDLPKGRYRAEWLDTKTGAVQGATTFDHPGGDRKLRTRPFDDDIALRIVASK